MGGRGFEAGLFAGAVERSDGLVAREISAQRTGFVIEPEEDGVAPAPQHDSADDEGEIADQGQ